MCWTWKRTSWRASTPAVEMRGLEAEHYAIALSLASALLYAQQGASADVSVFLLAATRGVTSQMPAVWAVAALATASAHAWRERMSIATTILRSSEPVHSATINAIIRINEWISSAVPPPLAYELRTLFFDLVGMGDRVGGAALDLYEIIATSAG